MTRGESVTVGTAHGKSRWSGEGPSQGPLLDPSGGLGPDRTLGGKWSPSPVSSRDRDVRLRREGRSWSSWATLRVHNTLNSSSIRSPGETVLFLVVLWRGA